jgi:hypothetical protein
MSAIARPLDIVSSQPVAQGLMAVRATEVAARSSLAAQSQYSFAETSAWRGPSRLALKREDENGDLSDRSVIYVSIDSSYKYSTPASQVSSPFNSVLYNIISSRSESLKWFRPWEKPSSLGDAPAFVKLLI